MFTLSIKSLGYYRVFSQNQTSLAEAEEKTRPPAKVLAIRYPVTYSVILAVLAASIGFYAGQITRIDTQLHSTQTLHMPNAHIPKTFTSNVTFGKAPSPKTDSAWKSLYPGMQLDALTRSR